LIAPPTRYAKGAWVITVELYTIDHLFELFGFTAQAIDLCPAGDSGLDAVAKRIVRDEGSVLAIVG
jgi:hypothetical protein